MISQEVQLFWVRFPDSASQTAKGEIRDEPIQEKNILSMAYNEAKTAYSLV